MTQRVLTFLAAALSLSLMGCGNDGESTPPSPSVPTALQTAQTNYPDLATQILPLVHIDPLDNYPTAPASVALPAHSRDLAADPLTISVADLETSYETLFCQLNSKYGVTLQSPQCQANINYISRRSGTGYFDLNSKPILNNPSGVTGVLFTPVDYDTQVRLPSGDQSFHVSAGMILPQGISGSQVKGVIVYFHGTTFAKGTVGSNYLTNGETRLTAQVFASQGYVVLIPDYVGQGIDWRDVHPYVLYPEVSAKTAVDLLSAAAPTIQAQYGLDDSAKLKLFSAGYSEGGAYSLWFNTYVTNNPTVLDGFYELTHSVGMEGAYDTSTVTKGFLFDDVTVAGGNAYDIQVQLVTNLVKPLLSADAFLSYAAYQQNGDFASVFNPDFFNLTCSSPLPQSACDFTGQNLNMADAFAQADTMVATQVLFSALKKSANGSVYPFDLVFSTKNSVNSLVSATFLSAPAQAQLDTALRAADVSLGSSPENSVSIVSLDLDSVVSPVNYKTLLAKYPTKVRSAHLISSGEILVVSPLSYLVGKTPLYVSVDHLQALTYEFLYALNIFNSF